MAFSSLGCHLNHITVIWIALYARHGVQVALPDALIHAAVDVDVLTDCHASLMLDSFAGKPEKCLTDFLVAEEAGAVDLRGVRLVRLLHRFGPLSGTDACSQKQGEAQFG